MSLCPYGRVSVHVRERPQSLPGAHVLRDSGRDGLFGRPGGAPHADGQLARKDHGPRDGPRAAVYRRARPHAHGRAPGVDGRVRDRPRRVSVCGFDDPAEVPAPPGRRDLRGQVRDRVPHDGLQPPAAGASAGKWPWPRGHRLASRPGPRARRARHILCVRGAFVLAYNGTCVHQARLCHQAPRARAWTPHGRDPGGRAHARVRRRRRGSGNRRRRKGGRRERGRGRAQCGAQRQEEGQPCHGGELSG